MTQRQLNRFVAAATGEDIREIRRRGFSIVQPNNIDFDPEPNDLPPQVVDWDEVDALRRSGALGT